MFVNKCLLSLFNKVLFYKFIILFIFQIYIYVLFYDLKMELHENMEEDNEILFDRSLDHVKQVIELAKLEESELHSYSQVRVGIAWS